MASFSASDAAIEGFRVLLRHWRVVLGWGGFNIVAMLFLIVAGAMFGVGLAATGTADAATIGALLGPIIAALGAVLVQTMVAVGVYRLMLRPEDAGFLHLRLGRDEIRLLGITCVAFLGALLLGGAAFMVARTLYPVTAAAPILVGAVALGVAIWLILRFGLAAPMSFAEGRIDFLRSWRLTRGHVGALLGMWLLNLCLVLMVAIVWWLSVFLLVGLLTGFGGYGLDGAEALRAHPVRYLLEGASPLVITPIVLLLQQAAFVSAYQALSAEDGPRP